MAKKMVFKKSWEEFRESGIFQWMNCILHAFGWAICVDVDPISHKIVGAYPARVKFRGFDTESNDKGYKKIAKYMKDNAEELYKETLEDN